MRGQNKVSTCVTNNYESACTLMSTYFKKTTCSVTHFKTIILLMHSLECAQYKLEKKDHFFKFVVVL